MYFLEDKVSLSCGYVLLSETQPHLQSTSPQSRWGNADNCGSPGMVFGSICHFCNNLKDRDRNTVRLASPAPQPAKLFLTLLCCGFGFFFKPLCSVLTAIFCTLTKKPTITLKLHLLQYSMVMHNALYHKYMHENGHVETILEEVVKLFFL